MSGPPVVITTSLGRPVTNVANLNGALPMVVVESLGEPVTLVDALGEPVTLLNPDGTLWSALTDLQRLLALSPSLVIWPEQGAGWQGTSGGTLAASGQPLGLGADLSQLEGKTLDEWLAAAPELLAPIDFTTGWNQSGAAVTFDSASTYTAAGVANVTKAYFDVGKTYVLTINATFTSSALLLFNAVNATNQIGPLTSGVTSTLVFNALNANLNIRPTTAGTVTINSVSLKELPGNHLRAGTWASPSDAARGTFQNDAINFSGVDDYYSLLSAINVTESMTVVRAFKRATNAINSAGFGTNAAVPNDAFWFGTDKKIYAALTSGAAFSSDANTNTGSFVVTSQRSASTEVIRVNGVQVATRSAAAVGGSLTFFGRANTAYNSGEQSFAFVSPSELTGADLTFVEQIAAATNGATLS
jgi:hypothetical protein